MWCARGDTLPYMVDKRLSEELTERIGEALRNSPAQDVERNVRALLAAWLDRLDLVLRGGFEGQKKLLERAQAKLAGLERRTTEVGSRGKRQRPPENAPHRAALLTRGTCLTVGPGA